MGYYSYRSTATFRKTDDGGWCWDESMYEIWAGYGRKWKRKVGTIKMHDTYDDYDNDNDTDKTEWKVELDYGYMEREIFPTLAEAKRAVKKLLDGGIVDINNSTEVDYLRRITDRRYNEVWSD